MVEVSSASLARRDEYRYGLAGRYRPAASQLVDLTADFAELRRLLERRRAILVPTRLTRTVAQMAKLMAFSLNRLDQSAAARNWARMAKHVAKEAGDNQLHAEVLNEEAFTHYYNGNLVEVVYVAAHAQHVAGQAPCASVAFSAALEARAHALGQGDGNACRARPGGAGIGGNGCPRPDFLRLGYYSEARLSFHTGNAYTPSRKDRHRAGRPGSRLGSVSRK